MKNYLIKLFGLVLICLISLQCNTSVDEIEETSKISANDPFRKTIVPSQYFSININEDNIIEGENGTIVVIPKDCFVDAKGVPISGQIQIELAEAFSLDEMLLSNLTTSSNGNLLKTEGMIFINATQNEKQLVIDKENPIYIDIPTSERKAGMMAFKGLRDGSGNMNWIEPVELNNFLVPVDINLLDFYPKGFEAEVSAGMPYRKYDHPTKELTDSLYFSLSINRSYTVVYSEWEEPDTLFQKPYLKRNGVNGGLVSHNNANNCGVDPLIIKVIKDEKFKNTFISTREFESRIQSIFKTCTSEILEFYVRNLDMNLWELDSIVAGKLEGEKYYSDFNAFYMQKLTNVENANIHSKLLRGYFEQKLKEVRVELELVAKKAMKEREEKNKVATEISDQYKELLSKRERYRMEGYGFIWTDDGWINIDIEVNTDDWVLHNPEVTVENGNGFDRIHTYLVYASEGSLIGLDTDDDVKFYIEKNKQIKSAMPLDQLIIAVSIAYKGNQPFMDIQELNKNKEFKLTLNLKESSIEKIKEAITPYDSYEEENRIEEDLKFMALFDKEIKRNSKLYHEGQFINRLTMNVYPCCTFSYDEDGNEKRSN
jgi:hypothetical protein